MLNIVALQTKFNSLSLREQRMLMLGTPVIICLFSWLFIIQPIIDTEKKLTKAVSNKQLQLDWMLENALKVKSSSPATNNRLKQGLSSKSQLRQVMNMLLKKYRISIDRIQNVNQKNVSYQLNYSNFNNILKLIKDSEEHGVTIVQLQVGQKETVGINTRLVVGF
jgi:type II secretory pathway component PulM